MIINVLNEQERLFEFIGTAEEIDTQGDYVSMDQIEPVMPVFIDRGGPLTVVHTANVVGKLLGYDRVPHPSMEGKDAMKLTGKIFKNYPIDDQVWEAIKNAGKKGGATGASWFGMALTKYNQEIGATEIIQPQITSWGIVMGNRPDGTEWMPVNRSSQIIDVNMVAKAGGSHQGTVTIALDDGSVKKFTLQEIFKQSEQEGLNLSDTKLKAKAEMPATPEASPPAPNSDFVTRDEFNAAIAEIKSMIEGLSSPAPTTEVVAEAKADPSDAAEKEEKKEEASEEKAKAETVEKMVAAAIEKSASPLIAKAIEKAFAGGNFKIAETPRPSMSNATDDEMKETDPRHPRYAVAVAMGKVPQKDAMTALRAKKEAM